MGFENVVKATDVEELLRQQLSQLSPSNNNMVYTL